MNRKKLNIGIPALIIVLAGCQEDTMEKPQPDEEVLVAFINSYEERWDDNELSIIAKEMYAYPLVSTFEEDTKTITIVIPTVKSWWDSLVNFRQAGSGLQYDSCRFEALDIRLPESRPGEAQVSGLLIQEFFQVVPPDTLLFSNQREFDWSLKNIEGEWRISETVTITHEKISHN